MRTPINLQSPDMKLGDRPQGIKLLKPLSEEGTGIDGLRIPVVPHAVAELWHGLQLAMRHVQVQGYTTSKFSPANASSAAAVVQTPAFALVCPTSACSCSLHLCSSRCAPQDRCLEVWQMCGDVVQGLKEHSEEHLSAVQALVDFAEQRLELFNGIQAAYDDRIADAEENLRCPTPANLHRMLLRVELISDQPVL